METIEYRDVIDKSDWARGPWDAEPDKVQWRDDETGMACLIVRGPHGALCGYVGVPSGHPWHGKHYDDCGRYQPRPEGYEEDWYLDVHGGLTYADGCGHGSDPARGICHVPSPGEADDVWWLGFDCAHSGDLTNMTHPAHLRERWPNRGDQYRDIGYVAGEVKKLAAQAKAVSA